MHRERFDKLILGLLCLLLERPASAEEQAALTQAGEPGAPAAERELGVQLGLEMGGRVSPGGLRLGGSYLYRLSEQDWFDGGFGFTFGSGESACFRDRDDERVCDHGLLGGFGGEVFAGVRRFFAAKQTLVPYLRGGVALRLVAFSGDEVRGLALPVWLGAGVRRKVHERVVVNAEPQVSLMVGGGVEFSML
jgi:hypothetical protein